MMHFCHGRFVFIIANSINRDGMLHFVTSHQCFHCLSYYLFAGIQNEIDLYKTPLILCDVQHRFR